MFYSCLTSHLKEKKKLHYADQLVHNVYMVQADVYLLLSLELNTVKMPNFKKLRWTVKSMLVYEDLHLRKSKNVKSDPEEKYHAAGLWDQELHFHPDS